MLNFTLSRVILLPIYGLLLGEILGIVKGGFGFWILFVVWCGNLRFRTKVYHVSECGHQNVVCWGIRVPW